MVDDDESIGDLLGGLFQAAGYTVLFAPSGRRALELLNVHQDIGLMLTDVRMPDMSGLDLAREVHERWPHIRIVVMSGYPNVPSHKWRFVAKPFRMQHLLAEVDAELSGHGGQ